MAIERKKGAKSAARTELVAVRFDPETKYLMELAARAQHRSVANYVEWAVEESFKNVAAYTEPETGVTTTIAAVRHELWDPLEPDRLCILGSMFPHLLTHEEQKLWKLIVEIQQIDPLLSDYNGEMKGFRMPIEQLERVRKHWDLLKDSAVAGVLSSSVVELMNGTVRGVEFVKGMANFAREADAASVAPVKPQPKTRK